MPLSIGGKTTKRLKQICAKRFGVGDAVATRSGAIHVMCNESDAVHVPLHICRSHIDASGVRSEGEADRDAVRGQGVLGNEPTL